MSGHPAKSRCCRDPLSHPFHRLFVSFIDPRNVRHVTTNLEPSTIPEFVWQSPITIGHAQWIAMLEFHVQNPPTVERDLSTSQTYS